jgi:hypothetical protein
MYRTVKTSELQLGDIVNCHGMRCLIDREIVISTGHPVAGDGSRCRYTSALVLNRDEVPTSVVPLGFTVDFDGLGNKLSDEPRWTIQGNDLARWAVETS